MDLLMAHINPAQWPPAPPAPAHQHAVIRHYLGMDLGPCQGHGAQLDHYTFFI